MFKSFLVCLSVCLISSLHAESLEETVKDLFSKKLEKAYQKNTSSIKYKVAASIPKKLIMVSTASSNNLITCGKNICNYISGNSYRTKIVKIKINDWFDPYNDIEYYCLVDYDGSSIKVYDCEYYSRYSNPYSHDDEDKELKKVSCKDFPLCADKDGVLLSGKI